MLMLTTTRRTSLIIFILITLSTYAFAQEQNPQNEKVDRVKTGIRRDISPELPLLTRARSLAASTAYEAYKWDDRQAAVRVLSQAADLLWDDDHDRSRTWLKHAWELTDDVPYEDVNNPVSQYRTNSPQSKSRAIVLAVTQKRDTRLFNYFIDQLASEKERSKDESRRGIFDDRTARSEQLLRLALATVESNPSAAASLAERSLNDGVSFQFQKVLLTLRGRDEGAANRVLDVALNRLATVFTHPSEVQIIASYLFTPGRVLGVRGDNVMAIAVAANNQQAASYQTPAEADQVRARRFLAIAQQILLSMPSAPSAPNPLLQAQEFIALCNSLSDGFSRYAPELWIPIEQRLAQVIPNLASAKANNGLSAAVGDELPSDNSNRADTTTLNKLYAEGLEEAADKETDPIARKLAYLQAALATSPDDLDRGQRIAAKIQEDELREQVLSFLAYRTALITLERGQLDAAINLATGAKPMQRALVLITASQRLLSAQREGTSWAVDPRTRALEILSDADKILRSDNSSADKLRLRLGFVAALAPLDTARAFSLFNDTIAAINKTGSFDPVDSNAPRMANLNGPSGQSLLPRIRSGFGLKDALTPLVQADFENTVYVAGKLSAPAVRGTCMVEIAQIYLGKPDGEVRVVKNTEPNDLTLTNNLSVGSRSPLREKESGYLPPHH